MISSPPGERYCFDYGREEERLQRGVVDIGIFDAVARNRPELIVYIGPAGGNALPSIDTFKAIKQGCPSLCLSLDGSCPDWHPLLTHYLEEEAFSLVVNCDGNFNWPGEGHPRGLTMFHVIDSSWYEGRNQVKDIPFGFSGGLGSKERRDAVEALKGTGLELFPRQEKLGFHQDFCDWMLRCKWQLSIPFSGSGKSMQMKARILESARARCAVLEMVGAATKNWFKPFEEYAPYGRYEEIPLLLTNFTEGERERMALRMHEKAASLYSAPKFWEKVLSRV